MFRCTVRCYGMQITTNDQSPCRSKGKTADIAVRCRSSAFGDCRRRRSSTRLENVFGDFVIRAGYVGVVRAGRNLNR
ncbi:protein of unknown function (plasmid) [Caballeronia sp. S22]